jgi:hypothetical protein
VAQIVEDKYQEAERRWLECMERIGRKETAYFEDNNLGYTEEIIKMGCRRMIMLWVYSELVRNKKLEPVEKLAVDVKTHMWAFIKEICAGKTEDTKRMVELAKVFYVIEYFLNEQNNPK